MQINFNQIPEKILLSEESIDLDLFKINLLKNSSRDIFDMVKSDIEENSLEKKFLTKNL